MNLDTQNLPWIDVNYDIPNKAELLGLIKSVELVLADNKVDEAYDGVYRRAHNLTIGKLWEHNNINAEGYDMKPLPDQKPYKELLDLTYETSIQVKKDLDLPEKLLFHCGLFIFVPKQTRIAYHVDSFRNCNVSMPLANEGSYTRWKLPNGETVETSYSQTAVLDTYTPHCVDNRSDNDRYNYQLTFNPDVYIDDIRSLFLGFVHA
tara:strand:- start:7946 stop:8563 length:618 start_codon:yes stop_codon:yes gene_type:complete